MSRPICLLWSSRDSADPWPAVCPESILPGLFKRLLAIMRSGDLNLTSLQGWCRCDQPSAVCMLFTMVTIHEHAASKHTQGCTQPGRFRLCVPPVWHCPLTWSSSCLFHPVWLICLVTS